MFLRRSNIFRVRSRSARSINKNFVKNFHIVVKSVCRSSFSGVNLWSPSSKKLETSFQSHLPTVGEVFTPVRKMSSYPDHVILGLPALSPTMNRGKIVGWKKKEGDKLKAGDVIAEIETDKAAVDFQVTDDGFLAKILVPTGTEDIPIGEPIAVVVENQNDIAAFKDFKPAKTGAAPKEAPKQAATPPPEPSKPTESPKQEVPKSAAQQQPSGPRIPGVPPPPAPPKSGVAASPLAKATAEQQGIDLRTVQGSGPGGRIVQADLASVPPKEGPKAPQPIISAPIMGEKYQDIPLNNVRRVTAERLTFSKQNIPHYYLSIDVSVDKIMEVRKALAEKGYKLSINDFIIKASALSLKKIPAANSSWKDTFIRRYENVDINVAVNTEKGLYSPILRNADLLGLATINASVKALADKAREGKLSLDDLAGGTFTISNLGMFGIKQFAGVINPPQACILAVGTSEERVVVDHKSENKDKPFKISNVMSATLSCDHRVVDGAVGAQWLQVFKEYMEEPLRLLL